MNGLGDEQWMMICMRMMKIVYGGVWALPHLRWLTLAVLVIMVSACGSLPTPHPEQSWRNKPAQVQAQRAAQPVTENIEQADLRLTSSAQDDKAREELEAQERAEHLIWPRIRQGFALQDALHPAVEGELEQADPEIVEAILKRAQPYLYLIVEEVERRGMPMEIALLPAVESGFDPFADSSAQASGLWQFTPATGIDYGLRRSWWYDGRRDVLASRDAALDYLQKLQAAFNGDWLLALAAYNCGPNALSRQIQANLEQNQPTDFWNLPLYEETRHYVPKLLALRHIVENPAHYGVSLPKIKDEPVLNVVQVDSQIDLSVAAELTGLSMNELYRYNPGYSRWATDPNGPHRLLIPLARTAMFEDGIDSLPNQRRTRWLRHEVKRGENLKMIARRYNTTAATLIGMNDLSRGKVLTGQYLLVPPGSGHQYINQASNRILTAAAAAATPRQIYAVKSGDTLWSISSKSGVSPQQILAWNGIEKDTPLRPGQQLLLKSMKTANAPATVAKSSNTVSSSQGNQKIRYVVKAGDSLYGLARRLKVDVDELCRWNQLKASESLRAGQILILYLSKLP